MNEMEGTINDLAKVIERKCNSFTTTQMQAHIDYVKNLLGIEITPTNRCHENYVDAIYNRTIFYLSDLMENGQTKECKNYLDILYEYFDNLEYGNG